MQSCYRTATVLFQQHECSVLLLIRPVLASTSLGNFSTYVPPQETAMAAAVLR